MRKPFSTLTKIILCLSSTTTLVPAQEAWLLEMPNKMSDYLVKKSLTADYDKVAGIVEKIPSLIAAKQIYEIELVKWKAEGGKINPKKKVVEGTRTFNSGARYYSQAGDSLEHRKITITPATSTQRTLRIDVFGILPRAWTPTFTHKGEKLTTILLERHPESNTATVTLGNLRQLEFDAGPDKELVAWYSSQPLDSKTLSYDSGTALVANPKIKFGAKILTSIKKDGESLLRIEAHSQDRKTPETIALHHNEATFPGHSQTTGPLKLETIKIADKSFTKEEDQGAWNLTLTSSE